MDWWLVKQLRAQVLDDLREVLPEDHFEQPVDGASFSGEIPGAAHFTREIKWGTNAWKLSKELFFEGSTILTARQTAASEVLGHLGLLACAESAEGGMRRVIEMATAKDVTFPAPIEALKSAERGSRQCRENLAQGLELYLYHLDERAAQLYQPLVALGADNPTPAHGGAGQVELSASQSRQVIPPGRNAATETDIVPVARRGPLTVVIGRAQEKCRDPFDSAAVWVELLTLAEQKQPPLLGVTNEGLQYRDGEEVRYLSLKNLRDRLRRAFEKGRAKAR